jgi:hypothetical protein
MKQRRLFAALMLAAILALALAGPASAAKLGGADQGGRLLTTTLTGAEEVPGPGDPDGTGFAAVTVNPGQGLVCYELASPASPRPRAPTSTRRLLARPVTWSSVSSRPQTGPPAAA